MIALSHDAPEGGGIRHSADPQLNKFTSAAQDSSYLERGAEYNTPMVIQVRSDGRFFKVAAFFKIPWHRQSTEEWSKAEGTVQPSARF
jgi:hypothetical protein